MEDIKDNINTADKRYYMSHTEYVYSDKAKSDFKRLEAASLFNFNDTLKLSQLVCATNQESAKKAVTKSIEESGEYLVLKCRIDYLIVGE